MATEQKHKRKSLSELFTNLDMSTTPPSDTCPTSPKKRAIMKQNLRDTISRGWPTMSQRGNPVFMTIHADDVYRQSAAVQDPAQLFEKAKTWISAVQAQGQPQNDETIVKEVHEAIIRAIFGSNQIERAGLNLELTVQLCRQVLAGEEVDDLQISEREPSYQNALLELYRKQPGLKAIPARYVLRSRNEVVQHARAFQHIIHAFVVEKQDLTEELLKETHRILVKGVPIVEDDYPDVSPEQYAGIYRTVIVGAGTTNFTVPKFVPAKMKEMCEKLKNELDTAETNGSIDPFSVATKYSMDFVSIHPFRDGNGRMCRMILNAILCRYAGIVVPIGEQGEERREYMGIKRRASEEMHGHGEYATFVLQRATTRLREMKKKMTGKKT